MATYILTIEENILQHVYTYTYGLKKVNGVKGEKSIPASKVSWLNFTFNIIYVSDILIVSFFGGTACKHSVSQSTCCCHNSNETKQV